MRPGLYVLVATFFLSWSQLGCTSVLCGEGTVEQNGECVPADGISNAGACSESAPFNPDTG